MLSLFIAAALQFPVATQSTAAYLNRSIETDEIAVATVKLWIDAKGRARGCDVLRFAGDESAAKEICKGAIGAPFNPARAPAGEKIHGLFIGDLSVYPDQGAFKYVTALRSALNEEPLPPDFVFSVSDVPERSRVGVSLLIDEAGSVTHCDQGSEGADQLTKAVCDHALTSEYERRLSDDGEVVRYVRTLVLEFEHEGSDVGTS